jgi:hypothetical protein
MANALGDGFGGAAWKLLKKRGEGNNELSTAEV